MKILWVEDNDRFPRIAGAQFLAAHLVTRVGSLEAARDRLQEEEFEVVLLDYDLPDGKGDTLLPDIQLSGRAYVVGTSSHEAGNTALVTAGANASCSKLQFAKLPMVLAKLREK